MASQIILLSGPIAAGKSTLAKALVDKHGCHSVSTRQLILTAAPRTPNERRALQRAGDRLDKVTKGEWVGNALVQIVTDLPQDAIVVVDSVRIKNQEKAIRRAYHPRVVHLHLTAPDSALASRYASRTGSVKELSTYAEARRNRTEAKVGDLQSFADVVIDTSRCTSEDVLTRAASHLGFYGRSYRRLVDVIVGGLYGSEGKGQIAAHIAREYDFLMRVGGPNAGHKVFELPQPYTHHHLPSGTRKCDAKLILGAGAVLYVPGLLKEINECGVTHDRLSIDPQAMIITEEDRRNERGTLRGSISSTAQGVGFATARRVLRGAVDSVKLARDIAELSPFVRNTGDVLDEAFYLGRRVLLEGTQGTGLSLYHGTYPYVTSRETTVSGCLSEAGIAPSRVRKIVMVSRTYPIRVAGNSGPMGQEIDWPTIADRSNLPLAELVDTERTSTTNRQRRVAEFNWGLLRKSASVNGPTDIAVTFIDYLHQSNRRARRFDQLEENALRFIEEVERVTAAPVSLITTGFNHRTVIDRRAW